MSRDGGDMKQAMTMMGDYVLGAGVLIVLGVLAGTWLDGRLHTAPLWTVLLSVGGAGLGLARLVLKALHMQRDGGKRTTGERSTTIEDDMSDNYRPAAERLPAKPPGTTDVFEGKKDANPQSAFDFLNQEDQQASD